MIIIRNKILPFKGYRAITFWPFIFVRKGTVFNNKVLNHEKIHGKQQLEMLIIPFYIWYVLEWLIRLFMKGNAYRNISFEREAYRNEYKVQYIKNRKHYSWIKYLTGF